MPEKTNKPDIELHDTDELITELGRRTTAGLVVILRPGHADSVTNDDNRIEFNAWGRRLEVLGLGKWTAARVAQYLPAPRDDEEDGA